MNTETHDKISLVMGLDLGSESGVCRIYTDTYMGGHEELKVETIKSPLTGGALLDFYYKWATRNLQGPLKVYDLVAIEDYAIGVMFKREVSGERAAMFLLAAHQLGVPVIKVSPGQVKKWATGKGVLPKINGKSDTKKQAMIDAAGREGISVKIDHEADAYFIAQIGWYVHTKTPVVEGPGVSAELCKARLEVLAAFERRDVREDNKAHGIKTPLKPKLRPSRRGAA